MKAAWAAGERAEIDHDSPESSQHRLAMVMTINAALGDPEAVMRALRVVRDQLIANDPALALMRQAAVFGNDTPQVMSLGQVLVRA